MYSTNLYKKESIGIKTGKKYGSDRTQERGGEEGEEKISSQVLRAWKIIGKVKSEKKIKWKKTIIYKTTGSTVGPKLDNWAQQAMWQQTEEIKE